MHCPFKIGVNNAFYKPEQLECEQHQCAWWVTPYTTEDLQTDGMCAVTMIAMKAPAQVQV